MVQNAHQSTRQCQRAILNMTAAEVFNHPALFRLEMRMLREATAVMRALGFRVVDLPGVPVRALALGTKLPGFLAHPLMHRRLAAVAVERGHPSTLIFIQSGKSEWNG